MGVVAEEEGSFRAVIEPSTNTSIVDNNKGRLINLILVLLDGLGGKLKLKGEATT